MISVSLMTLSRSFYKLA